MMKDPTEFRQRFAAWKAGKKPYKDGQIQLAPTMLKMDNDSEQTMRDTLQFINSQYNGSQKQAFLNDMANTKSIEQLDDYIKNTYNSLKYGTVPSFKETRIIKPGEKTFHQIYKPLPKYDDGTDDKTYLPEYEYEVTVTPQGTSLEKHKRITNEEDWQKYWGNVGAGYVNQAQEAAAPVVLNGMSMLMGNPVGALAGILGSEVGSGLGAKISPQASAIGGLVGGFLGGIDVDDAKNLVQNGIKFAKQHPVHLGNWYSRIPENENYAYRILHNIEADDLLAGNELRLGGTNPKKVEFDNTARSTETPRTKRRFTLYKASAEHGGRKQFSKGQPWVGTTVTNGEKVYLRIPGSNLEWKPGRHFKGDASNLTFESAPFGSHIDLLADSETGLTSVNPSLMPGSELFYQNTLFGHPFGYISKSIKPSLGEPSDIAAMQLIQQNLFDNYTKFRAPFRNARLFPETVGDVVQDSYYARAFGGRDKLLTDLSTKEQLKLAAYDASQSEPIPFRDSNVARFIHMDDTGPQPVSKAGLVPKDATNSNSPWNSSGTPKIWWAKNKPYYPFVQYIPGGFESVPRTYVASEKNLVNNNLDGLRSVYTTEDVVPFTSIDYAIQPNMFGSFDLVKFYDKGKSIHINPANKGKFNATKKRTGKTTEQLAHSKNPLTRKRAIFALNARKWHH